MMGTVVETVSPHLLGPVRYHNYMEEFAGTMVRLGAVAEENAIPAGLIAETLKVDKKTVYNRLARPGFVKVDNGKGATATYYYLFNDRFAPLARSQGAEYYPLNLGPLAVDSIPKVVERDLSRRIKTVDIRGNSTAKDDLPVMVRAVEVSNSHMKMIMRQAEDYGAHLQQALSDPINNLVLLENLQVMLAGTWRWVERYNSADVEKQIWMRGDIRHGEEVGQTSE